MLTRSGFQLFFTAIFLSVMFVTLTGCKGGGGGGSSVLPSTPPVPSAPTSVVSFAGDGNVALRWSSVPYATTYTVLRSDVSGTSYVLKASGLPNTLYTDMTVTNGQTYYYVVRSKGSSGESGNSAEASATPQAGLVTQTISGTAKYVDKLYDISGFTGNTQNLAVRYATVELVDSVTKNVLASTSTSSTGTFSFNVSAYTYSTVYVSLLADAKPATGEVIVRTDGASPAIYAVAGANILVSNPMAATQNFLVPVDDPATGRPLGGAFNILDVFTGNDEFLNQGLGVVSIPTLSVYWPSQSGGTYYCNSLEYDPVYCDHHEGIYVLSETPASPTYDTDEYDDDVIRHEFGHFAAYHFSKDDSIGGTHAFWINDYDLRLAWSEGWADFFEAAVKNWLANANPSLLSTTNGIPVSQYVDTATTPHYYYNSITWQTPEAKATDTFCNPGECVYSSNETAVANVLWHLMDTPGSFGMQPIWDVFSGPMKSVTTPVNMEAFWDEWLNAHGTDATLTGIFGDRLISYVTDSFEPDDSVGAASGYTAGAAQSHTLYSDLSSTHYDEDYVSINVTDPNQLYTVTTSSLRNGAAPYIDILSGGTVIASSDPGTSFVYNSHCDGWGCHVNALDTLATSITFTAPVSNVFVRIRPSFNPSLNSAGRYGSYLLTISP